MPKALESQIWSWVDSWLADMMPVSFRIAPLPMGLMTAIWQGRTFLPDWLRDIMLQNAAVLQHWFPLFSLWRHPVISDLSWRLFATNNGSGRT
jgi:Centromere DNA-binding protein complex CBF3 subunit, domain 2